APPKSTNTENTAFRSANELTCQLHSVDPRALPGCERLGRVTYELVLPRIKPVNRIAVRFLFACSADWLRFGGLHPARCGEHLSLCHSARIGLELGYPSHAARTRSRGCLSFAPVLCGLPFAAAPKNAAITF